MIGTHLRLRLLQTCAISAAIFVCSYFGLALFVIATATALATILAWSAAKELRLLRASTAQSPIRTPFATLLALRIVTASLLLDALIHLAIAPNWRDPLLLSLIGTALVTHALGHLALYFCIGIAAGTIKAKELSAKKVAVRTIVALAALGCCFGTLVASTDAYVTEISISILVGIMIIAATRLHFTSTWPRHSYVVTRKSKGRRQLAADVEIDSTALAHTRSHQTTAHCATAVRQQKTGTTKSNTQETSAYDCYESELSILKRLGRIARYPQR